MVRMDNFNYLYIVLMSSRSEFSVVCSEAGGVPFVCWLNCVGGTTNVNVHRAPPPSGLLWTIPGLGGQGEAAIVDTKLNSGVSELYFSRPPGVLEGEDRRLNI